MWLQGVCPEDFSTLFFYFLFICHGSESNETWVISENLENQSHACHVQEKTQMLP